MEKISIKKIDPFRLWAAVGGRKFIALIIACVMELTTGGISQNLLIIIITFMGANVVKDVGINWLGDKNEKVRNFGVGDIDAGVDNGGLSKKYKNPEVGE